MTTAGHPDDLLRAYWPSVASAIFRPSVEHFAFSAQEASPGRKVPRLVRFWTPPIRVEGLASGGGQVLFSGSEISSTRPRWTSVVQGATSLELTGKPTVVTHVTDVGGGVGEEGIARPLALNLGWRPTLITHEERIESDAPEGAGREAETDRAPWLPRVVERLAYLLRLPPDWDGEGAERVDFEQALDALTFLSRVMRPTTAPPAISPLGDGGLQIDWHRGGVDVEAVFSGGPAAGLYWLDLDTDEEFEGSIDAGIEGLLHLMNRLENPAAPAMHAPS